MELGIGWLDVCVINVVGKNFDTSDSKSQWLLNATTSGRVFETTNLSG